MSDKVVKIIGWHDGGPNDHGFIYGFMKHKNSYFRPATEEDGVWSNKVVTDEFKKDFKEKFGKTWSGFYSAYEIDKDEYDELKNDLLKKLEKFDI